MSESPTLDRCDAWRKTLVGIKMFDPGHDISLETRLITVFRAGALWRQPMCPWCYVEPNLRNQIEASLNKLQVQLAELICDFQRWKEADKITDDPNDCAN